MSKKNKNNKVLVLNGPNLNLLGTREPNIYGHETLASIEYQLQQIASNNGITIDFFQSNYEGELIDKTQSAINQYNFIIVNPAAFTHTSIAWRDAILAVNIPFIEVHLSNTEAREEFRHKSVFADKAIGVIKGLGSLGYYYALDYYISKYLVD